MPELTELHPAVQIEPDPLALIRECVPTGPFVPVVNALAGGMEKHGPWNITEGRAGIIAHLENHFKALKSGECYDKDDGQHHAASIVLRGLQVLDIDSANG